MNHRATDAGFVGSIPSFYERYLVPLIFKPYAADLAGRVAERKPSRVLEIAAGTGVVTRELAKALPRNVEIVASDLNRPMLDQAASIGTARPVEWREANAMNLPFHDESFDVVVCQFATMFFPEKTKAFSEARRVLRRGGHFVFSVWDRIEDNDFADVVTRSLEPLFPDDPPRFLARVPHGYYDQKVIARDLEEGGFTSPAETTTIAERSRASSARIPAVAYCEGTPLRNEIELPGSVPLEEATEIATRAIAERFGSGEVDGKIQAHIIAIQR